MFFNEHKFFLQIIFCFIVVRIDWPRWLMNDVTFFLILTLTFLYKNIFTKKFNSFHFIVDFSDLSSILILQDYLLLSFYLTVNFRLCRIFILKSSKRFFLYSKCVVLTFYHTLLALRHPHLTNLLVPGYLKHLWCNWMSTSNIPEETPLRRSGISRKCSDLFSGEKRQVSVQRQHCLLRRWLDKVQARWQRTMR